MIIGYSLFGVDNNSSMLNGLDSSRIEVCPVCKNLLDYRYYNPFFKLKKKSFDLSSTYENKHIVSLKFKEFCKREKYTGLTFKEFEWEPNFFYLIIDNILQFDFEKRQTRFINLCHHCGNYNEVIGNSPAYLKSLSQEVPEGIYRTDLLFGTGNSKQPLIIVGSKTRDKLKREKLKGLVFEEIVSD